MKETTPVTAAAPRGGAGRGGRGGRRENFSGNEQGKGSKASFNTRGCKILVDAFDFETST